MKLLTPVVLLFYFVLQILSCKYSYATSDDVVIASENANVWSGAGSSGVCRFVPYSDNIGNNIGNALCVVRLSEASLGEEHKAA